MSISNETQYSQYYSEITLTRVKSLKCNELISLLRCHSDLG
jgi:hypothetical protein